MMYLAENLKKYRLLKNLTQEDIAEYLNITPQSVSKWERSESYPDITFLPALANILETSIDLLLGMDTIRSEQTRYAIHSDAHNLIREGRYAEAEKVYRDALLIYPNKPGMMLGLCEVLALTGNTSEAIELAEKGLAVSENEKQKATIRALLCFLYLKNGQRDKAEKTASILPHMRECREVIQPLVCSDIGSAEIEENIRLLILGE